MRKVMITAVLLLAALTANTPGHMRAQEAPDAKPAAATKPEPGKLVPFAARYDAMDKRMLYRGAVQYSAETLAALEKAGVPQDSPLWWSKRARFYRLLAEQPGFGTFLSLLGDGEVPAAACGEEFLLLALPEATIAQGTFTELAEARGLKLLEFAEYKAEQGLCNINPGFTADAVRAFWVKGRKVEWQIEQPRKETHTVNGEERVVYRFWKGTCTTSCTEAKADQFTLCRNYALRFSTAGSSGSSRGGDRVSQNSMTQMLLSAAPLTGQFVNMPWLECYATKEETTLNLGGKDYKCVQYNVRKRHQDASGSNYVSSQFFFCTEVPGVPLKVVYTEVDGDNARTSTQVFESTVVE
ncbi:MAG: hypothetical protein IT463_03785 [Planctomycetes bacterium]|nr:hypothetical protein [Planctomycetota bacterium]